MTLPVRVNLRKEAEDALMYLLGRLYEGQTNKRGATMQRALIEIAQQEAAQELLELAFVDSVVQTPA